MRVAPARNFAAAVASGAARSPRGVPSARVAALLSLALAACAAGGSAPVTSAGPRGEAARSLPADAPGGDALRGPRDLASPATPRSPLLPAASAPREPQLALGTSLSCLLLTSGEARCWGDNDSGQLGDPSAPGGRAPRRVPLPRPARALRVFERSLCALLDDASVACWGDGFGPSPAPVTGLPESVDVAVGDGFACALGRDARVRCFGANGEGQLGDGTTAARAEPPPVAGLGDATAIGAGSRHACALARDGTVRCWGSNAFGQLGDGSEAPSRPTPAPVAGIRRAARLAVGDASACSLFGDATARCWGSNLEGRLHGDDFSGELINPLPLPFPAAGVRQLAFGSPLACGLFGGGRVECWGGRDESGETGPAAFGPRGPGRYGDVRDVAQVAAGSAHACALLRGPGARGEPRVRCWGSNLAGALGVPERSLGRSRKPVAVRFP